MDTKLYTQCPQCQSVFTIEVDQLLSAEGKVQCGVCFGIFDAPENFVLPQESDSVAADIAPQEQPRKKTISFAPPADRNVIEQILNDSIREATGDAGSANKAQKPPAPKPLEPTTPAPVSVEQTLGEDQPHPPEQPDPINSNNLDSAALIYLDNAQADSKSKSPWTTRLVMLLIVILSLGFAGHFAWQNRMVLSQKVILRPWYDLACKHVDCGLLPLRAVKQISVTNSQVRKHSSNRKLITIDMILVNNATFKQPFPSIEVVFLHPSKEQFSTQYSPEDYLSNVNIAPTSPMDPNIPVQISVDAKPIELTQLSYEVKLF